MSTKIRPARGRCPTRYEEILESGLRRGLDFRVLDGNLAALGSCLLAAPHGGKIEPATSEIVKAVADLGPWAWYSFEGRLPTRNWLRLHITSTSYDEPRLLALLPQTEFVIAIHGMDGTARRVDVGGRFLMGRLVLAEHLRRALNPWGATVAEAEGTLAGLARRNLVNHGARGVGIQIEIPKAYVHCLLRRREPSVRYAARLTGL